jgi:putative zinc finger/helix-turn-helix YgiT family protein
MPHALLELFARYGYFVIVAGVLLENAGIPAPGHTVVLAGAFLASRGALSLPILMTITAASAVVGDNVGYWIGRRGGRGLVERHGRLFHLTPERLARAEQSFEVVSRFPDSKRLGEDVIAIYRRNHGLLSADEIRAIRERFNLTQADLAHLLRLGANTVSRWESGRNVQTAAMDILLRMIRDLPGSIEYLRDHAP